LSELVAAQCLLFKFHPLLLSPGFIPALHFLFTVLPPAPGYLLFHFYFDERFFLLCVVASLFLCVKLFYTPFFFLEKKKMVVGETPTTGQKFKENNSIFKIHNSQFPIAA